MKGVIYARYSSDNQREESIEGQLRECKEYAERNGITILKTYVDRALSAKTDHRPDFQNMIKDSGKGLFDVVIVWKLDRFARNRYDSAHYKSVLRKNGVKVVSAKEAIAEDSTGILLEKVRRNHQDNPPVRCGTIVIDSVEFMFSDNDQIPRLQSIDVIFHHISGISLQKQKNFILIVIVKVKMGIGGSSRI